MTLWVILVETPQSPELLVKYKPSVHLLDLIVYVMGGIGAWFGVSFMDFNLVAVFNSCRNAFNRSSNTNDISIRGRSVNTRRCQRSIILNTVH